MPSGLLGDAYVATQQKPPTFDINMAITVTEQNALVTKLLADDLEILVHQP